MKKIILFTLLAIVFLPLGLSADCLLDNTDDLNGFTPDPAGTLFGQQFLACETGTIESILLNVQSGAKLDLYMVAGDGQTINLTQPHQTYENVDVGNKMVTFVLDKPFEVVKGQLYAFGLRGTMVNYDKSPNPVIDAAVADGQSSFVISPAGAYAVRASSDLYFKISNKTQVIAQLTQPIPSLSQWGLLIFGLLILNLGVGFVYKINTVQSKAKS